MEKGVYALYLSLAVTLVAGHHPIVESPLGKIQGTVMKSRKGGLFYAFRGIPFAKPPLGELRFRPPQPVDAWDYVLDATEDKSRCIQLDFLFEANPQLSGLEDCLYLNVYTPKHPNQEGNLTDVLFYIHGGGWLTGYSTSNLYGPHYFMDRDVVLVTFNYRLGALGFLSTEDAVSPGNYGMKDQVQALRWVRDNIRAFGGDPERITMFGQSVGGASTHYHIMSPMSAGLFHRAILHSGSALLPFASARDARGHAKRQAEVLGCPTNSSHALVNCLRTKDAADIVNSYTSLTVWDLDPLLIFAVVPERDVDPGDEVFLHEEPYKLLSEGNYCSVPLMAGVTAQDGAFRTGLLRSPHLIRELDRNFSYIAPITYRYEETAPNKEDVTRRIRDFYFGNLPIEVETERLITEAYTDRLFLVDLIEALNTMTMHNMDPAYLYNFSYRGNNSFSTHLSKTDYDFGVCHQDDLIYLFSSPGYFPPLEPGSLDDAMVDVMLDLWVNFARTGNPTPHKKSVKWPQYTTEDQCYLDIGSQRKVQCGGLRQESVAFWNSLCLRENGYRLRCEYDDTTRYTNRENM